MSRFTRIAVKPRSVICAISSIVPISPWNRMRVSSPSNFISVEGSSCASRFRFVDDDSPSGHLPQRPVASSCCWCETGAEGISRRCWLQYAWQNVRDYRNEDVIPEKFISTFARKVLTTVILIFNLRQMRLWTWMIFDYKISRRHITVTWRILIRRILHASYNARFLFILECLHFVPRAILHESIGIRRKFAYFFFPRWDKLIIIMYNGRASNKSCCNLWFSLDESRGPDLFCPVSPPRENYEWCEEGAYMESRCVCGA